jgi:hypothetical protein
MMIYARALAFIEVTVLAQKARCTKLQKSLLQNSTASDFGEIFE